MLRRLPLLLLTAFPLLAATAAAPEGTFRYTEGRHGNGQLRYIEGLPVLTLSGTPEEIAEQEAMLAAKPAGRLLHYPKALLSEFGMSLSWPWFQARGKDLLPQFPADHRREFDALIRNGLDADLVLAGNTMFDVKKWFCCSSMLIESGRSATAGPLMGRNLDFPTLGYLQQYSLVKVYHPTGKRAFGCIGFPGLVGCLSGMNDAGLVVAVLEVFASGDNSPRFDKTGTPYGLLLRRVLEECSTVAEAEKLLSSAKRTTRYNVAVCDPNGGGVFEVTTKTVTLRPPENGVCLCTNHFCTSALASGWQSNAFKTLDRYRILRNRTHRPGKFTLEDIAQGLHAVHQGEHTLQSMIFEPAELRLHLAIGACPSSGQTFRTLDLSPLLLARPGS